MTTEYMGWKGELKPEGVADYITKHREIWPEMADMIADSGVRNYSIFVHGTTVFGYYESADMERSLKSQSEAEVTTRWGEHMDGLFASEGITPMERVMFLPGLPD